MCTSNNLKADWAGCLGVNLSRSHVMAITTLLGAIPCVNEKKYLRDLHACRRLVEQELRAVDPTGQGPVHRPEDRWLRTSRS